MYHFVGLLDWAGRHNVLRFHLSAVKCNLSIFRTSLFFFENDQKDKESYLLIHSVYCMFIQLVIELKVCKRIEWMACDTVVKG